ncbi:uncharacterized protein IWZ02DRAFT_436019 [Phyllosticta citriasiana]
MAPGQHLATDQTAPAVLDLYPWPTDVLPGAGFADQRFSFPLSSWDLSLALGLSALHPRIDDAMVMIFGFFSYSPISFFSLSFISTSVFTGQSAAVLRALSVKGCLALAFPLDVVDLTRCWGTHRAWIDRMTRVSSGVRFRHAGTQVRARIRRDPSTLFMLAQFGLGHAEGGEADQTGACAEPHAHPSLDLFSACHYFLPPFACRMDRAAWLRGSVTAVMGFSFLDSEHIASLRTTCMYLDDRQTEKTPSLPVTTRPHTYPTVPLPAAAAAAAAAA